MNSSFWQTGILVLALTGCAVNYSNPHTGAQHLWGLGQLGLKTDSVGEAWMSVTTGSRIPGLCMDFGPRHLGLSFGFLIRQETVVVETNRLPEIHGPERTLALPLHLDANSVWGLGHLKMKSVASTHGPRVVISGRALAGLSARLGGGDSSVRLGTQSQQRCVVLDQNIYLTFVGTNQNWPHFNFFKSAIRLPALPGPSNPPPASSL